MVKHNTQNILLDGDTLKQVSNFESSQVLEI